MDIKAFYIIQALAYTIQITNPVTVAILIRTRVDLIDDSSLPPKMFIIDFFPPSLDFGLSGFGTSIIDLSLDWIFMLIIQLRRL